MPALHRGIDQRNNDEFELPKLMRFPVNVGCQFCKLLFHECLIDLATSFGSGLNKRTILRLCSCILPGNGSLVQEHNLALVLCSHIFLFDFLILGNTVGFPLEHFVGGR
jgi:hypothetical protein